MIQYIINYSGYVENMELQIRNNFFPTECCNLNTENYPITHNYQPFGNELTAPNYETNTHKFTGHERDPETALDYMLARYCDSTYGRFLQVDPFEYVLEYEKASKKEKQKLKKLLENPMLWNKYAYCNNNPTGSVDPDGKFSIPAIIVFVVTVTVSAVVIGKWIDKTKSKAKRRQEKESFQMSKGEIHKALETYHEGVKDTLRTIPEPARAGVSLQFSTYPKKIQMFLR